MTLSCLSMIDGFMTKRIISMRWNIPLSQITPKCLHEGVDLTIVGLGYGTNARLIH